MTTDTPADPPAATDDTAAAKARAEAAKIQAEAEKANADAEKTRAEAEKTRAEAAKTQAEAAKTQAEADKAGADAEKARADAAEYDTPAARRLRHAKADKEEAEADKDARVAARERWQALVPDLGDVKDSTFDVSGDRPVWGHALAHHALTRVAADVGADVKAGLGANAVILVTPDTDFTTTDGVWADVTSGIADLDRAFDLLLTKLGRPKGEDGTRRITTMSFVPGEDLAAAVMGALPSVLSLLAAKRSLAGSAVSVSDLAAAAAIAGVLVAGAAAPKVVHDDLRLLSTGGVYEAVANLNGERHQLDVVRIDLVAKKTEADEKLATATAQKKALAEQKPPPENLNALIDAANRTIGEARRDAEKQAQLIAVIDALCGTADEFLALVRKAPDGGGRSPLAVGALHEALHGDSPAFTHVLLVHADGGEAQQLVSNRPLWWRDRVSTVTHLSLTYVLFETQTSFIVRSGTKTGSATAHGKVGTKISVEVQ